MRGGTACRPSSVSNVSEIGGTSPSHPVRGGCGLATPGLMTSREKQPRQSGNLYLMFIYIIRGVTAAQPFAVQILLLISNSVLWIVGNTLSARARREKFWGQPNPHERACITDPVQCALSTTQGTLIMRSQLQCTFAKAEGADDRWQPSSRNNTIAQCCDWSQLARFVRVEKLVGRSSGRHNQRETEIIPRTSMSSHPRPFTFASSSIVMTWPVVTAVYTSALCLIERRGERSLFA